MSPKAWANYWADLALDQSGFQQKYIKNIGKYCRFDSIWNLFNRDITRKMFDWFLPPGWCTQMKILV